MLVVSSYLDTRVGLELDVSFGVGRLTLTRPVAVLPPLLRSYIDGAIDNNNKRGRFLFLLSLRCKLREKVRAARLIQRRYRSHCSRVELERCRAARVVQQGYRGHRCRVELERHRAARVVQHAFKQSLAHVAWRTKRLQQLVKIQLWYRGVLERSHDDVYDRLREDHTLLHTMKMVLWSCTDTFFDTSEAYATRLMAARDGRLRLYKSLARQSRQQLDLEKSFDRKFGVELDRLGCVRRHRKTNVVVRRGTKQERRRAKYELRVMAKARQSTFDKLTSQLAVFEQDFKSTRDALLRMENKLPEGMETAGAEELFGLGLRYDVGCSGVERDVRRAGELYALAADKGSPAAQAKLGSMYEHGRIVGRDCREAARLYTLAADQGHVAAHFDLARLCSAGRGVEKDCARAARLFEVAAERGHVAAQTKLAVLYMNGLGVGRNDARALELLALAADRGDAEAQFNLGFMYECGQGVDKDVGRAADLLALAAAQGFTPSLPGGGGTGTGSDLPCGFSRTMVGVPLARKCVIRGFSLGKPKEFSNNLVGVQMAWRCARSKRVKRYRPEMVACTLAQKYGTVVGSGKWTKEEHALFVRAYHEEGVAGAASLGNDALNNIEKKIPSRNLNQVRIHARTYVKAPGSPSAPDDFWEDVFIMRDGNCFFSALVTAVRHSGNESLIRVVNEKFFPEAAPYCVGEGVLGEHRVAGRALRTAIGDQMDSQKHPATWWCHGSRPWHQGTSAAARAFNKLQKEVERLKGLVVAASNSEASKTKTGKKRKKSKARDKHGTTGEVGSGLREALEDVEEALAKKTQSYFARQENATNTPENAAHVEWKADLQSFREYLAGGEYGDRRYDSARLVGVLSSMCPELFVSVYDGNVNRPTSAENRSVGRWVHTDGGLSRLGGRQRLMLHGDGEHFVPLCLRDAAMETVDDVTVELFRDREGVVPPGVVVDGEAVPVYRCQSRDRLKRGDLGCWQQWHTERPPDVPYSNPADLDELEPTQIEHLGVGLVVLGQEDKRNFRGVATLNGTGKHRARLQMQGKQAHDSTWESGDKEKAARAYDEAVVLCGKRPLQLNVRAKLSEGAEEYLREERRQRDRDKQRLDLSRVPGLTKYLGVAKYVEAVCQNNHDDLQEETPSLAYPYLDVGHASAPDVQFGERWRVVGSYKNGESSAVVPVTSAEDLKRLLDHPSELDNEYRLTLVMRRCSARRFETCKDPDGRVEDQEKKHRERDRAYREGNGRVSDSYKYTDPGKSPSVSVHNHLEMFYKEANLSLEDPGPDYCPELTNKEKAELLVEWDRHYNNSTRISTCASCGRRDCDERLFKNIFVPVSELSDVFEITLAEHDALLTKGHGLFHLMEVDGRYFHLVDAGTQWVTKAEQKELFGTGFSPKNSHVSKGGGVVGGERSDLFAAICTNCKSSIALNRSKAETISDETDDDPVLYPKNSVRFADWGKDPVSALQLPALSMLEKAAISKYITSYNVVTVMAGPNEVRKLNSQVVASPHNSTELIASLMTALPRIDIHEHVTLAFVGTESQKRWILANANLCNQLSIDLEKVLEWLRFLQKTHPAYGDVVLPITEEDKQKCRENLEESRQIIMEGVLCDDLTSLKMHEIIHSDTTMDRKGGPKYGELRHVLHMSNPAVSDPDLASFHALHRLSQNGRSADASEASEGDGDDGGGGGEDDPHGSVGGSGVGESSGVPEVVEDSGGTDGDGGGTSGAGDGAGNGVKEGSAAEERHRLEATLGALGNEFENNHEIIAGAHPTLFPCGLSVEQFRTSGTPNKTVVRQLMHWYDGRFAGCEALMFQLFNQMMRHKVIRNVNAHLNGTNDDIDALILMVEDPHFEQELRREIKGVEDGKPITPRGREILNTVQRACKISGQRVPWTRSERCGTTALITALSQRFGCAAVFVTVSPPQFNSPLAIRLSLGGPARIDVVEDVGEGVGEAEGSGETVGVRGTSGGANGELGGEVPEETGGMGGTGMNTEETKHGELGGGGPGETERVGGTEGKTGETKNGELGGEGPGETEGTGDAEGKTGETKNGDLGGAVPALDWTLKFPELTDRINLLARNPVADAKTYEKVVNAFFSALVQCSPVGDTRSTAHEVDNRKRGAFGYTRAFFGITECQRKGLLHLHGLLWTELDPMTISQHIHKQDFRDRVVKYIDSILSCELETSVMKDNDMHRKTRQDPVPHGMHEASDLNAKNVGAVLVQQGNEDALRRISDCIDQQAGAVNASTCLHRHTFTCYPKDGSAAGRRTCKRCRLDMGRAPSGSTRFMQAVWAKVKDPGQAGDQAASIKIKETWAIDLHKPVSNGFVLPIGTAVLQETTALADAGGAPAQTVSVRGVLGVELDPGVKRMVVVTTDSAGFNSTGGMVVGSGDVTFTVHGEGINNAQDISEWRSRLVKKCSGQCNRWLEGGMFNKTQYDKGNGKCRRCVLEGRCVACESASACDKLKASEVDLLHQTCQTCGSNLKPGGLVTMEGAMKQYQQAVVNLQKKTFKMEHLQALELLKSRNFIGYHGTIADRLVEIDAKERLKLWAPMAAVAGDKLHHVMVSSLENQTTCENYLEKSGLQGKVTYLVPGKTGLPIVGDENGGGDGGGNGGGNGNGSGGGNSSGNDGGSSGGASGAESDAGVLDDADGQVLFLADHFPRPNSSLERVINSVFGRSVLCLGTGLRPPPVPSGAAIAPAKVVYGMPVKGTPGEKGDWGSAGFDFHMNGAPVAPTGGTVDEWYSYVSARTNLSRVLRNSLEKDMYKFHELNPPSKVVAIDRPPCDLLEDVGLNAVDSFRKKYMHRDFDQRCIVMHHQRSDSRSRYQSEASPICSALLKSNTLMSIMPSLVSAKSATYYLAKYFRKDSVAKKDILILYNKAKQLQKKFRSCAKDAVVEADRRATKNFVQKLMNKVNGSCEYTSTQVAQMLLGHESQYSSHAFWYLFVDPMVANQRRLHRADTPPAGDVEEVESLVDVMAGDGSEWGAAGVAKEIFRDALFRLFTSMGDDGVNLKNGVDAMLNGIIASHPHHWRDVVCNNIQRAHGIRLGAYFGDADWDDDLDDGSLLRGVRGFGNAQPHTEDDYGTPDSHVKLYRTNSNKIVRTSQHHDYAHRGVALECLTPWEYAATVLLRERGEEKVREGDLLFEDLENGSAHKLVESHKQLMRDKFLVPILASKMTPPPFPGPKPENKQSDSYKKWLNKAGRAAEYYGCLFVPHCIKTGKAPCQGSDKEQAWDQLCTILQGYKEATAETREDYKILNARFATIFNVAHCQRSSRDCNMLNRAHRGRFSDDLQHVKRRPTKNDDGGDNDAVIEYMEGLAAEMNAVGSDSNALRQQENLRRFFGGTTATDPTKAIGKVLAGCQFTVQQSMANHRKWSNAGKNYQDRLKISGSGLGSVNARYAELGVQSAMVRLLGYVESRPVAGHTFTEEQLMDQSGTVEKAIFTSKRKEDWLVGELCWQDALIRGMVACVEGDQDLVHGFLEGLSVDQLEPYLEALQTVNNHTQLRLLIHAPPGSGKT